MALRQLGQPEAALATAERAVAAAASGDCLALEHGLALAEAACSHLALGGAAAAERCRREAHAIWAAGQVQVAELHHHAALAAG